jgi:hypothetical protein
LSWDFRDGHGREMLMELETGRKIQTFVEREDIHGERNTEVKTDKCKIYF